MKDVLIVGGVFVGLWLLKRHLDAQASTSIPTAAGISTAPTVSGGYQTVAPSTLLGVTGYGGSSSYSAGTVPSPAPIPAPPPPYYGGAAGGVGSGGNPLGGTLRAGVSAGTGTTMPAGSSFRVATVGPRLSQNFALPVATPSVGPSSEARSGRGHF